MKEIILKKAEEYLKECTPRVLNKPYTHTKNNQRIKRTPMDYITNVLNLPKEAIDNNDIYASDGGTIPHLNNNGHSLKSLKEAGITSKFGKGFDRDGDLLYLVKVNGKTSHFHRVDPQGIYNHQTRNIDRHPDYIFYNQDVLNKTKKVIVVKTIDDALNIRYRAKIDKVISLVLDLNNKHIDFFVKNQSIKELYICYTPDKKEVSNLIRLANLRTDLEIKLVNIKPHKNISNFLYLKNKSDIEFTKLLKSSEGLKAEEVIIKDDKDGYFFEKSEEINGCTIKSKIYFSNFRICFKKNLINENKEIIRIVTIIDKFGHKIDNIEFEAEELSAPSTFYKKVLKIGNFVFEGSDALLKQVVKLELSRSINNVVYLLSHIGFIKDKNVWAFADRVITTSGDIFPDESGVFWLNDWEGLMMKALDINKEKEELPRLEILDYELLNHLQKRILTNLKLNLGGYNAWLILGWIKANIYSYEIHKKFGFFPILFLDGKHGAGKSYLAERILLFFGIESDEFENLPAVGTTVGIERKAGFFSSLPVVLDEYRNDGKVQKKDGFIRGLYNRKGRSAGLKGRYGTYSTPIRSNFCICGEELPNDAALLSRCIPISLIATKRDDAISKEIEKNSSSLSGLSYKWIKEKNPDTTNNLLSEIEKIKNNLIKEGIDTRSAGNYAVAIASFQTMDNSEEFYNWAVEEAKKDKSVKDSMQIVNIFLYDCIELLVNEKINYKDCNFEDDNIFNVALYGYFQVWQKDYRHRNGVPSVSYQTLLNLFKAEPFFMKINANKRFNGNQKKCIVFDLDKASEALSSFASIIKETIKDVKKGRCL